MLGKDKGLTADLRAASGPLRDLVAKPGDLPGSADGVGPSPGTRRTYWPWSIHRRWTIPLPQRRSSPRSARAGSALPGGSAAPPAIQAA
jgi:hypothetical protein